MPSRVPSTKLITVAVPTSPSVHGSAPRMTLETGDIPLLVDTPRLACSTLLQKCTYWLHRLWLVFVPNSASSARRLALVITWPCMCASTASTGFPGMTRGIRKSTVTAATAVSR